MGWRLRSPTTLHCCSWYTLMTFLNGFSKQSTVHLFADDSFLYRKIYSRADSIQLHQDLHQLAAWERTWLMSFKPSKCQLLRITKRRSPIQYDCTLHVHRLEQVSTAKYTLAWTCMNSYPGISIPIWQLRRPARSDPSLPGTFTPVPRRLRLHVTPHLHAQRWNMLPRLGHLILHRTVINWNRSSDVLLGLHATGTREQPAWQLLRLEVGDIGDQA